MIDGRVRMIKGICNGREMFIVEERGCGIREVLTVEESDYHKEIKSHESRRSCGMKDQNYYFSNYFVISRDLMLKF